MAYKSNFYMKYFPSNNTTQRFHTFQCEQQQISGKTKMNSNKIYNINVW